MLNEKDGKMLSRIMNPVGSSVVFIESRRIIYRYLSLGRTFLPGLILRNSERLLETLADCMDYSVNAPSRIRDRQTMTDEFIFISLVSFLIVVHHAVDANIESLLDLKLGNVSFDQCEA